MVMSEKLALKYYDVLTAKLYQGVPKVVSGVAEKTEVIVGNLLVDIVFPASGVPIKSAS
jgi:hypothetical protein